MSDGDTLMRSKVIADDWSRSYQQICGISVAGQRRIRLIASQRSHKFGAYLSSSQRRPANSRRIAPQVRALPAQRRTSRIVRVSTTTRQCSGRADRIGHNRPSPRLYQAQRRLPVININNGAASRRDQYLQPETSPVTSACAGECEANRIKADNHSGLQSLRAIFRFADRQITET